MKLITTLVVSFCKDGGVSVSVNLWCLVVCVLCEVHHAKRITAININRNTLQATKK